MKLRPRFELLLTCELAGLDPNRDLDWTDAEMELFVETKHTLNNILGVLILREQLRQMNKGGSN